MFAASGSSLPLPSSPQIAPVVPRAEPMASAAAVTTQTAQAVKQSSPIRFNPHITYANDIDRVLVQVRDEAGEVTVQYPSEKAVREYRRQMEASRQDASRQDASRPEEAGAPPSTSAAAPEGQPAAAPASPASASPASGASAPVTGTGAGAVEISA